MCDEAVKSWHYFSLLSSFRTLEPRSAQVKKELKALIWLCDGAAYDHLSAPFQTWIPKKVSKSLKRANVRKNDICASLLSRF